MNLNSLLRSKDLDPRKVLVFRHRPTEPSLQKALPWLASDRPDMYNAYQQTQGRIVEKAMLGTTHIASFIGHEPGKALFVGLYSIGVSKPQTREQYWQIPAYVEMKEKFALKGFTEKDPRTSTLWFDLMLTDFYDFWKGKLIIEWPGLERSWWRYADRNEIRVHAILEDNALDRTMPKWNELALTWEELNVIPKRWQSVLTQWRGIYYIFDTSDCKGYVGSACGENNLLGRWQNYRDSGHGGNNLLRKRDPKKFLFTILERVSPDMGIDDLIQIENTWKERLHTRHPYGLNDN